IGRAQAGIDCIRIVLGCAPAFEQSRLAQCCLQLCRQAVGRVAVKRQCVDRTARAAQIVDTQIKPLRASSHASTSPAEARSLAQKSVAGAMTLRPAGGGCAPVESAVILRSGDLPDVTPSP